MNKASLIFIFAIIAVSKAEFSMFAEVDKSPFGAALMDLVQINMQANAQANMKTSDSVDQLQQVISDLLADMTAAKKQADQIHKEYRASSAVKIRALNKTLVGQRAQLAATQKQLRIDRDALKTARSDRAAAKAHLAKVVAQIVAADKENARAVAAYNSKVKDLKEAIQACKDANLELAKLNAGSFAEGVSLNLLEVKGNMQKIETTLQSHLPQRLSVYRPILQALADMGTNADPVLVKKVMGFINQLRSALEDELAATHRSEKVRVADYKKLRADLVDDQVKTQANISRLNRLIKSLKKSIAINEDIELKLKVAIPISEKLLAIAIKERKIEKANYIRDNAQRESELAILRKLQAFFEEKFSKGFSDYLRQRVAL